MLRSLFGAAGAGGGDVGVTAVGDPNQSIYGWRGASATTLTRFPREFADETRRGAGAAAADQLAQRPRHPRRRQHDLDAVAVGDRRAAARSSRRRPRSGRGGAARDDRGRGGLRRRLGRAAVAFAERATDQPQRGGAVPEAGPVPARRRGAQGARPAGRGRRPGRAAAHPGGERPGQPALGRPGPVPRRPADAAAHRAVLPARAGRPRRARVVGPGAAASHRCPAG